MGKFCSNCGSKVDGKFCTVCGKEVLDQSDINNQVNNYVMNKINKAKNHTTYKKVSGIIMMILGIIIAISGSVEENRLAYELLGIDVTIVFTLPGLLCFAGGLLSLINGNNTLLISGICYLISAFINIIGISDVSLLCIADIVFGIINIVFANREKNN